MKINGVLFVYYEKQPGLLSRVCKVPIVVPLTRSYWYELSDEKYIRLCSKRCLDLYNLTPGAD